MPFSENNTFQVLYCSRPQHTKLHMCARNTIDPTRSGMVNETWLEFFLRNKSLLNLGEMLQLIMNNHLDRIDTCINARYGLGRTNFGNLLNDGPCKLHIQHSVC
jgi:hypothetical protein